MTYVPLRRQRLIYVPVRRQRLTYVPLRGQRFTHAPLRRQRFRAAFPLSCRSLAHEAYPSELGNNLFLCISHLRGVGACMPLETQQDSLSLGSSCHARRCNIQLLHPSGLHLHAWHWHQHTRCITHSPAVPLVRRPVSVCSWNERLSLLPCNGVHSIRGPGGQPRTRSDGKGGVLAGIICC